MVGNNLFVMIAAAVAAEWNRNNNVASDSTCSVQKEGRKYGGRIFSECNTNSALMSNSLIATPSSPPLL
uniref:Putative secreted peptide n=1 Tax=Anopheles braziliensis TaxID=58242 RepID=A0A2M3ZS00_9DIPT